MEKKSLLFRLFVLVAAMMCALGASAAEAYACYTPSNTTLTFYYDNSRSSRTNTYDLNTGTNRPGWYSVRSSVTKVVFNSAFASARPTSTYYWFYGMSNLTTITGINYLNTSQVTTMTDMFGSCSGLTSLNVSNFNTAKVTDMSYMFSGCSGLTSLNVSNFNTAKVTDMTSMFYNCSGLTSLDLSNFNTANVTEMDRMFYNCSGLKSLDLSNFNTAKVTIMQSMFENCSGLTSLDVSNFNTARVTDMQSMFENCDQLKCLNLSSFNTSNVTLMHDMFQDCSNLTTIYVGSAWSTASLTIEPNANCMFLNCFSLVGGMGTIYNEYCIHANYAHIDGGTANPGYLSEWKEAYACYTPSNTTLTFYYDSQRASRTGTTYSLDPLNGSTEWHQDGINSSVTRVVFNSSFANARPTTTASWFYYMTNLTSITGMNYLNTSEVTDMSFMFGHCTKLQSVDVSNFNTAKVTNMRYMFDCCEKLTSLNVSSFNTAKVTDMECMFESCDVLTSLNLNSFNTAQVTDMDRLFWGCSSLTNLNVANFNTSKVTSMECMFYNCYGLTSLDLSSFNTSKVTNMGYMFYNCNLLTTIYVGGTWSTAAVSSSTNMFFGCFKLKGGKGTAYNANYVDKTYARVDGGTSSPGYLTAVVEAYACYTSSNTTLTFYYDNLRGSRSGTTYDLNTGNDVSGWYFDNTFGNVKHVVFNASFAEARPVSVSYWFYEMRQLEDITGMQYLNTSNVTSMKEMFNYCVKLTSLNLSNFNTAKVTDMSGMFNNCQNLTSLDLSSFNTANVTSMKEMFNYCEKLTSLSLSNFNTANVTDMSAMFRQCTALTSLNVSNFNTAKVTTMSSMFSGCEKLTSLLDMSNWNTGKVTNMSYMFSNCKKQTSLNVSNFNTAKVTTMSSMFSGCESLTNLDLSNFNTAQVTSMSAMFYRSSNLSTIYVGSAWSTEAVTSSNYMFRDCTSLVGGKGTTYDANHVDKTYAHIDGGTSNPGYLSSKSYAEPYVVFLPSDGSLTFYCDDQRDNRTGTTFDLNPDRIDPAWTDYSIRPNVTKVAFDPSFANARPTTTYCWFFGFQQITSITGLHYLNTSEVTDMYAMFLYCSNLTSLDLSGFNTSKVTNMGYLFSYCGNLNRIFVGNGWNTDAVSFSYYMFLECPNLEGCQGTYYDADHVDATYAHIDGGTSNPGYLSELVLGDVNGDGNIDVEDVTTLINAVLNGISLNPAAADVNGDNLIDVIDVTTLIARVLSGSW